MTIHLITKSAAIGGNVYSVEMPDGEVIPVLGCTERHSESLYYAAQNAAQFKTYELFTSEIFHLIFSDRG